MGSYYFPKTIWMEPDSDDPDQDLIEFTLPTHKEVCPRCDGEGKHVNPSIDGFTRNDLDEWFGPDQDDFINDYMSGVYDVRCETCEGLRVVDAVDYDRMTPQQQKAYDEWMQSHYETEAIYEMERRMGA